ncbi:hypothetical protein [[Mycoplasma] testudinis]|uniref:hypothetical protein n=1 Tax=[Mycoplasma] testudinis TaxID=33924 RepID=UPI000482114A|nr:hypothetical protein [[Mycoplasma] testudinis]
MSNNQSPTSNSKILKTLIKARYTLGKTDEKIKWLMGRLELMIQTYKITVLLPDNTIGLEKDCLSLIKDTQDLELEFDESLDQLDEIDTEDKPKSKMLLS